MTEKTLLLTEFKDWLIGILEDDPLDYELTTVYFLYGRINNMVYIRLLATEIDNGILSDFTYNPLEAQFFYSKYLFKTFQNENNLYNLRNFIKTSLDGLKKEILLKSLFEKKVILKQWNFYI